MVEGHVKRKLSFFNSSACYSWQTEGHRSNSACRNFSQMRGPYGSITIATAFFSFFAIATEGHHTLLSRYILKMLHLDDDSFCVYCAVWGWRGESAHMHVIISSLFCSARSKRMATLEYSSAISTIIYTRPRLG